MGNLADANAVIEIILSNDTVGQAVIIGLVFFLAIFILKVLLRFIHPQK